MELRNKEFDDSFRTDNMSRTLKGYREKVGPPSREAPERSISVIRRREQVTPFQVQGSLSSSSFQSERTPFVSAWMFFLKERRAAASVLIEED